MIIFSQTIKDGDDAVTIEVDKTYEFPPVMMILNNNYPAEIIAVELTQYDLDTLAKNFAKAAEYERNFDDSKVNYN